MCLRERDAIIGNARFRFPRKVEEETALVSEARTQSTKYKEKGNFREWQRTRTFKFPGLEVGTIFKDYDFHFMRDVENNVENMDISY